MATRPKIKKFRLRPEGSVGKTLTHTDLHALASRLCDEAGGYAPTARIITEQGESITRQAVREAITEGRNTGTLMRIVEALHGGTVEVRYLVSDSS